MRLPQLGIFAMLLTSSRRSAVAFSARLRYVPRPSDHRAPAATPRPMWPAASRRAVHCGGLSPAAAALLAEQQHAANVQVKANLELGRLKRVKVNVAPEFRAALRLPKKKKTGRLFVDPATEGSLAALSGLLARHLGLPLNAFCSSGDESSDQNDESGGEAGGETGSETGSSGAVEPLAFLYGVNDAEFEALCADGDCRLPLARAAGKRLASDEDLAAAWAELDASAKGANYSYLKVARPASALPCTFLLGTHAHRSVLV